MSSFLNHDFANSPNNADILNSVKEGVKISVHDLLK